jgi:uncharacterized membrane protein (DUF106 family)
MNLKKRKSYVKYLLTSAIFFYLTLFYIAYFRNDSYLFILTLIHLFLFFAVYYMAFIIHQLGKDLNNFLLKTIIYLTFYLSIAVLLAPITLLACFAGYLLSNDTYFEELLKKIKTPTKKFNKVYK